MLPQQVWVEPGQSMISDAIKLCLPRSQNLYIFLLYKLTFISSVVFNEIIISLVIISNHFNMQISFAYGFVYSFSDFASSRVIGEMSRPLLLVLAFCALC